MAPKWREYLFLRIQKACIIKILENIYLQIDPAVFLWSCFESCTVFTTVKVPPAEAQYTREQF